MLKFDRRGLLAELDASTPWRRVVFVASCVEVLIPGYARFSELEGVGDTALLRDTLDAVWAEAGRPGSESVAASVLPPDDAIEALLPAEEDWNDWAPQAEDAVAALMYLTRLIRGGDIAAAAYAAARSYSAFDEFVARRLELRAVDHAARVILLSAPEIQAELRRQRDVLRRLAESADGDPETLAAVRDDARADRWG
ncbi:hypothetical protein Val02_09940 [Virgisporangium aliadipatigenens]|uniref:DUF416 family protein n=1 Tax=Virgisporangium aliadipatigenens TaxID=741659 RepID=A0A8J3YHM2_9ACTN|nr:DUF416 family protein [Virgisporangium aliadipatigenens]GIJ44108.1 hypothetical protein Val02_09940 [Virgisporangium aliadipatigenens]